MINPNSLERQIEHYAERLRQDLNTYWDIASDAESHHKRSYAMARLLQLEDALSSLHVYTEGAFGTSRAELREARPDPFEVTTPQHQ